MPDSDLGKWDALLRKFGYVTFYQSNAFHQYDHPQRVWAPVDLIVVSPETFAKMTDAPKDIELHGVSFQVPRLAHLFALKLHAIRSNPTRRFERDMGDILELMQANRITLEMPEYRATFDRYATPELQREVEMRLARTGFTDR